jgi:hypothetical protein
MTFFTAARRLADARFDRDRHRLLCPHPADRCLRCRALGMRVKSAKRDLAGAQR